MFCLTALVLAGCGSTPQLRDGREVAEVMAGSHGWQPLSFDVGMFVLKGYARPGPGSDLMVYIEGDGRAWIKRHVPSNDPTPKDPIALRLAIIDPAPKVLYLGRPCQYTTQNTMKGCHRRFWTISRFSQLVVEAMDAALTQAKKRLGAERLHLIGYSGGGALAVLLASRRKDIATVITVAGNLDHQAWTRKHRVTPLSDSLNPVDAAFSVRDRPQVHLVGLEDDVMPPLVARSFLERMGKPSKARLVTIPGFDHRCCWVKAWAGLLAQYRPNIMTSKEESNQRE